MITTLILLIGSCFVLYNAIGRIINPKSIHYNGMILFAVVGVVVNFCAAFFTREGDSLNQKAVNLHMLEDVLGWAVVLVGAVVMRFTNFSIIDPILSMVVAVFIFVNAVCNLKEALDLFLEKAPRGIAVGEIKERIMQIEGVLDVHHIHIWSIDGRNNYATMHIVTDAETGQIKNAIRMELQTYGIGHATLELEEDWEHCGEKYCRVEAESCGCCHHHHHH